MKIGIGKPLGLGSIDVTIDKVRPINRRQRYSAGLEGVGLLF
jgi:hypothetical protein